jgi:hypothetical protein
MGPRPMAGDTDDPECLAGLRAPEQTPDARCDSDPRRLDLLMGVAQPHLQALAVHHAQAGA